MYLIETVSDKNVEKLKGGEKKQGFKGELALWCAIRRSKFNRKGGKLSKKYLKEKRKRQKYIRAG